MPFKIWQLLFLNYILPTFHNNVNALEKKQISEWCRHIKIERVAGLIPITSSSLTELNTWYITGVGLSEWSPFVRVLYLLMPGERSLFFWDGVGEGSDRLLQNSVLHSHLCPELLEHGQSTLNDIGFDWELIDKTHNGCPSRRGGKVSFKMSHMNYNPLCSTTVWYVSNWIIIKISVYKYHCVCRTTCQIDKSMLCIHAKQNLNQNFISWWR